MGCMYQPAFRLVLDWSQFRKMDKELRYFFISRLVDIIITLEQVDLKTHTIRISLMNEIGIGSVW